MDIREFLKAGDVIAHLRAANKQRALEKLAAKAATELSLKPEAVLDALIAREALGSTGMGDGVAIPHARLPSVTRAYGLFAQLRQPVDFQSIDGQAVDLIFLLLLPMGGGGDLKALADASRLLRDKEKLARLRRAGSAKELYEALVG